jgi:sugar transferase EpsL
MKWSSLNFVKRCIDVISASFLLIILSPVIAAIAVLSRVLQGSPVIYSQTRPGLNGKSFTIYKFRTMTNNRDAQGHLLKDEVRLTSLGKILRKTSIDELPELVNILKGNMSLVGPRPLLMQYLKLYTPEQARRLEVKPGITGWAQVNGRNAINWEEKFKLDVWYVDNQSLMLDLKILALTFWKVIKREGISQAGKATVEEFKGTLQKP